MGRSTANKESFKDGLTVSLCQGWPGGYEKWFQVKPPIDIYKPFWFTSVVIFQAHFVCYDIIVLSKSPIKWMQCPDKTISAD